MKKILCLCCLFLAVVFSACGSTETVSAPRPDVGINFKPPVLLGQPFELKQPVLGEQTGAQILDDEGNPVPCVSDAQCEGYVMPDKCFSGAACYDDFCIESIKGSCCQVGPQGVICPSLTPCGSDNDCADGNECTEDFCNFSVLDGGGWCNNYPAYIGEWVCGTGACQTKVEKCSNGQAVPESVCQEKAPSAELCDAKDNDCDGKTDEDFSDKGHPCDGGDSDSCQNGTYTCKSDGSGVECVNEVPQGFPGYEESCNGWDDDCDGETDEAGSWGCSDYYYDGDSDGYGSVALPQCLCAPTGLWSATKDSDCNDANAAVNPSVTELCNQLDDDCDGTVDEEGATGCSTFYYDGDADSFGVAENSKCLCAPANSYTATVAGDCNDANAAVNPSAVETCNHTDDDCDGTVDEEGATGCTTHYYDNDADNFGVSSNSKCLCADEGKYTADAGNDCNDDNAVVYPGQIELCNQVDDDCDGVADEDFPLKGQACDSDDTDLCAYGAYVCSLDGLGLVCANDLPANIVEVCDGNDNDCDQTVDEGFALGQDCSNGIGACATWSKTVCSDNELGIKCPAVPGQPGVELCGNQVDDDCDSSVDEGFPLLGQACDSVDSDLCQNGLYTCKTDGSGVECVNEHPEGIPEICNGLDDDCDQAVDEGFPLLDEACDGSDSDQCANGTYTCTQDGAGVECVNEEPAGLKESCNNWDDDCDGQTDEADACYPCSAGNVVATQCGGDYSNTVSGKSWFDSYSCKPTWSETGPEKAYSFTSSTGGVKVTAAISPSAYPSFFDIFASMDECGSACLSNTGLGGKGVGAGDKNVSWLAGADKTYYLFADGPAGVKHTLSIACSEYDCADGVDNDGDGLVDCADTDDCVCVPETCDNGVDDDNDGDIDCADFDCVFASNCVATCSTQSAMVCGVEYSGTTVGAGNDISGYSCTSKDQTGPDVAYSFTPDQDGVVVFGLSNLKTDLDLNILGGTCAANACPTGGHGNNWVTLNVTVGTTYFVMVDAVGGNQGTYKVKADCDWQ